MNIDDFDQEDEGWIWLPWEELREIQRERNAAMNRLLDNAAIAGGPRIR